MGSGVPRHKIPEKKRDFDRGEFRTGPAAALIVSGTGRDRESCQLGRFQARLTSSETDMDWRAETIRDDVMRDTRDDETAYAAGWTISGLATLTAIVAVWIFGI
jgi:hypothetical protein